jgi:cold shock CspA family protein
VKNFDAQRGSGFIIPVEAPFTGGVFVHYTSIRTEGFKVLRLRGLSFSAEKRAGHWGSTGSSIGSDLSKLISVGQLWPRTRGGGPAGIVRLHGADPDEAALVRDHPDLSSVPCLCVRAYVRALPLCATMVATS